VLNKSNTYLISNKPRYNISGLSSRPKLVLECLVLTSVIFLLSCTKQNLSSNTQNHKIIRLQIADSRFFGPRPKIIRKKSIYSLSAKQQTEFKHYYSSESLSSVKPYRRIFKYLQLYTKKYRFQNKTLTAEKTLANYEGNCLSLAILTTALAKTVSVKTGYQIVDSVPVYQEEGGIILASEHIQSLLYDTNLNNTNNKQIEKGIVVDYFPTRGTRVRKQVSENEFSALYYRNLAADAIVNRNYNAAY